MPCYPIYFTRDCIDLNYSIIILKAEGNHLFHYLWGHHQYDHFQDFRRKKIKYLNSLFSAKFNIRKDSRLFKLNILLQKGLYDLVPSENAWTFECIWVSHFIQKPICKIFQSSRQVARQEYYSLDGQAIVFIFSIPPVRAGFKYRSHGTL